MATLDTLADRSTGSQIAGKAYFETSTNKFIVWNGESWIELHSDGAGAINTINFATDNEIAPGSEPEIASLTGYDVGTYAQAVEGDAFYIYTGTTWLKFQP